MTITLRGITWQNPRGYDPLAEAARRYRDSAPDVVVEWEQQPWYRFEETILDALRRGDGHYDLIMFDHPWVGQLAGQRWLLPWETLTPLGYLDALRARVVAPSLESYEYDGATWALPLDAACHAGLYRADLVGAAALPSTWEGVEAFAQAHHDPPHRYGLVLSVEGVLGSCLFLSMMAGLGAEPYLDEDDPTCDLEAAEYTLTTVKRLLAYTPPGSAHWGPWDIYDHLCAHDDVGYSPSIFAYVNYFTGISARGDQLRLCRAPAFERTGLARPILGGVGLGIAHTCPHPEAAAAYGMYLMSDDVQRDLFPAFRGQPSARAAWDDAALNARVHNVYADLRANMASAYIRPRYPSFHRLELANGRALQAYWDGEADLATTLEALRAR
jgi:multiple sugar transport system substrate-binding protein